MGYFLAIVVALPLGLLMAFSGGSRAAPGSLSHGYLWAPANSEPRDG
jgi:hypothetical protein